MSPVWCHVRTGNFLPAPGIYSGIEMISRIDCSCVCDAEDCRRYRGGVCELLSLTWWWNVLRYADISSCVLRGYAPPTSLDNAGYREIPSGWRTGSGEFRSTQILKHQKYMAESLRAAAFTAIVRSEHVPMILIIDNQGQTTDESLVTVHTDCVWASTVLE